MIEARDLSRRYPSGKLALDALNLRVAAGEIHFLVGAPGAGKTTVINLFLGLIRPTSGQALVAGIEVAREPLQARRHLAYLGADSGFYERLTPRQNLAFFSRLNGGPRRGAADFDRVLREVGLPEGSFGRKVREFDAGMRQKLGVAAALLKDVPVLLLDEPLAGLDPRSAAECAELFADLRGQGKAILYATQELFWARQLADSVSILQEGRQVLVRSHDALRHEDLEQLYLGYLRGDLRSRDRTSATEDRPPLRRR
jgi:ABC-2 type transport system ATP-binding protein